MKIDHTYLIDSHRTQGEWKVKLTIAINFFFSKVSEEIRTLKR